LLALFFIFIPNAYADDENNQSISLWHSYRGAERNALDLVVQQWNQDNPETPVSPLSLPYEAYANKLTSAIPRGHGPDVFIAAHERIGDWSASGLIAPLSKTEFTNDQQKQYHDKTLAAFKLDDHIYGIPLAFKNAAFFVNKNLVSPENYPTTTDDLLAICQTLKQQQSGAFCIAYEAGNFYHHAAWLYGFGGGIFTPDGSVELVRDKNAASIDFVKQLTDNGYLPEEPSSSLVAQLFNNSKAAFVLNGPWFMGEIKPNIDYDVIGVPSVSSKGNKATPFLTVEGVLLSSRSNKKESALRFAHYLASRVGSQIRLEQGNQAVAYKPIYNSLKDTIDPKILQFTNLVGDTIPMPNTPLMRSVWEPASQALRKVLRGSATPVDALKGAQHQIKIVTRPAPQSANPFIYILIALVVLLAGCWLAFRKMKKSDTLAQMKASGTAYAYVAPAALGILVIVFVPFIVGTAVSLFSHRAGEFTFVGLSNFWNILSCADYAVDDPLSFYFTLFVTVMWTATNVFLHVFIGLCLALLLRDPWMKLRGIYRVLLIIPWAVPNYITALIWKGMFHKQFGAINGLLVWMGIEPVSWFSHFWTAFAANLTTNTWLGFPFMMVVTLGALQAIPRDLEEAAEVDGAGWFRRFFTITLPLLKPALLPAVILGSVWTFNMFNIIYLVSGGEPDGGTEILISEAYRWAFTRQEQYGYAAAYATLIFIVLLMYNWGTKTLMKES